MVSAITLGVLAHLTDDGGKTAATMEVYRPVR